MKMNKYRRAFGSVPLLVATGFVAIFNGASAADIPDSEQVSKLLSDIRTQAVILSSDASTMETYTRSSGSWQSHATTINQMRDHINEAGRQLTRLQELRKTASPWQAAAIDRIQPLLKELANSTEEAIKFINAKPERLFQTQYKDYLEANADVSSRLASMIGDFVDYGNMKNRLDALAAKLELPAKR